MVGFILHLNTVLFYCLSRFNCCFQGQRLSGTFTLRLWLKQNANLLFELLLQNPPKWQTSRCHVQTPKSVLPPTVTSRTVNRYHVRLRRVLVSRNPPPQQRQPMRERLANEGARENLHTLVWSNTWDRHASFAVCRVLGEGLREGRCPLAELGVWMQSFPVPRLRAAGWWSTPQSGIKTRRSLRKQNKKDPKTHKKLHRQPKVIGLWSVLVQKLLLEGSKCDSCEGERKKSVFEWWQREAARGYPVGGVPCDRASNGFCLIKKGNWVRNSIIRGPRCTGGWTISYHVIRAKDWKFCLAWFKRGLSIVHILIFSQAYFFGTTFLCIYVYMYIFSYVCLLYMLILS